MVTTVVGRQGVAGILILYIAPTSRPSEVKPPVQRPSKVTVKAVDLKGRPVTLKLDKFPSRIFQHEFDHLQVS